MNATRVECVLDGCHYTADRPGELCWAHQANRLYGWPVKPVRPRHCTYPGCSIIAYSRGFCNQHKAQIEALGVEGLTPSTPHVPCETRGCSWGAQRDGLCWPHWLAVTGRQPLREPFGKVCNYPDCGKPLSALGYCGGHQSQIRDWGIEHLRPLEAHLCTVDGCNRWARADGMCGPHWAHTRYGWRVVDGGRCNMTGCYRRGPFGGYCDPHYRKMITSGVEHLYKDARAPLCVYQECRSPQRINGTCFAHWAHERHGWPLPVKRTHCGAYLCERPNYSRNYCPKHSDMLDTLPNNPDPEDVDAILFTLLHDTNNPGETYRALADLIDSQPWHPAWLLMADTGRNWSSIEIGFRRIGRRDLAVIAQRKQKEQEHLAKELVA